MKTRESGLPLPLRRIRQGSGCGLLLKRGAASGRAYASGGFSLVEIMIVVTIISLLGTLAVPYAKRYQLASRATVVASDLRTFAAAFDAYAHESGGFPAESGPGEMPTGMAERLGTTAWLRPSPIGGQYNWENNQMHGGVRYKAAICISESSTVPLEVNGDLLQAIDKIIDDGDLSTGSFRTGVNNDALFIIQQ